MNEEVYDIDEIVYVDTKDGGHWTYTVRDFLDIIAKGKIVTCVYCGLEYPSGTPTSQHELLTAHIKVCPKHPMTALNVKYKALIDVVKELHEALPFSRMKNAMKVDLLEGLPREVFEDIFGKHPVVET
jgi:hypothetical protein